MASPGEKLISLDTAARCTKSCFNKSKVLPEEKAAIQPLRSISSVSPKSRPYILQTMVTPEGEVRSRVCF